jgi:hypothetical protein
VTLCPFAIDYQLGVGNAQCGGRQTASNSTRWTWCRHQARRRASRPRLIRLGGRRSTSISTCSDAEGWLSRHAQAASLGDNGIRSHASKYLLWSGNADARHGKQRASDPNAVTTPVRATDCSRMAMYYYHLVIILVLVLMSDILGGTANPFSYSTASVWILDSCLRPPRHPTLVAKPRRLRVVLRRPLVSGAVTLDRAFLRARELYGTRKVRAPACTFDSLPAVSN